MGFRIQNNITAMMSHRNVSVSEKGLSKSLERLSSGYRINQASDDAAGMASSMRFRAEISSLKVASRNTSQAISMLQVAEGAMSQIDLMLRRMKELATQAASGNTGTDRGKIDREITALEAEISRIVGYTQYDSQTLLDGTFGSTTLSSTAPIDFTSDNGVEFIDVTGAQGGRTYWLTAMSASADTMTLTDGTVSQNISYAAANSLGPNEDFVLNFDELGIQITVNSAFDEANFTAGAAGVGSTIYTGATGPALFQIGDRNNAYHQIGFTLPDLSLASLNGGAAFDIDLTTQVSSQDAMDEVDAAIDYLANAMADVGALVNRLQYSASNLSVSLENKTASESIIRDVDMAVEMSDYTKYNILIQSGMSMLAQANQLPQSLLNLLK